MTTTMTHTDHTDNTDHTGPAPTPASTVAVPGPDHDPHAGSVRPTAVRPAPAQATVGDRLARNVLERLLARLRGGTLTIVDHDGTTTTYGQGTHGGTEPSATVRLETPAVWSEVARKGSRGLGESYVDGWWATDDLVGLIRVLLRNLGVFDQIRNATARATAPVLDPWRRRRPPSKDRDRREIAAHYDLGNDFFELFLDPTMAYSCGLFPDPQSTLHEAQIAKFDRLLSSIDVGPGDRLVEIGTGWGGLAVHAAQRFGAQVTTTTISEQQHRHATALVSDLGLEDQVTVLLEDYRDLHGTYDKLVSVEMIEAVDWRDHDAFFGACNRLLSRQGRMAMQAITVADNRFGRVRNSEDFVKRHIFPGSCIPSLDAITSSTARSTDFWLTHLEEFPQHYAQTLHRWRAALDDKADVARSRGYDDALLRLWDFYLAYCEGAFAERYVSLVQVVLERPGSVPTRPELRS